MLEESQDFCLGALFNGMSEIPTYHSTWWREVTARYKNIEKASQEYDKYINAKFQIEHLNSIKELEADIKRLLNDENEELFEL